MSKRSQKASEKGSIPATQSRDPTPSTGSSSAVVYLYYDKVSDLGGNCRYLCKGCPPSRRKEGLVAKTTTNLIKHQSVCPGLATAVANKHPGLVPSNRDKYLKLQSNQLTISPSSGFLQTPWLDKTLKAKILRMISVESLPFSLVDSQSFKDLIQYCHEGASIPGQTTISNMIKSSYELVKTKVDHTVLAASKDTFIHLSREG